MEPQVPCRVQIGDKVRLSNFCSDCRSVSGRMGVVVTTEYVELQSKWSKGRFRWEVLVEWDKKYPSESMDQGWFNDFSLRKVYGGDGAILPTGCAHDWQDILSGVRGDRICTKCRKVELMSGMKPELLAAAQKMWNNIKPEIDPEWIEADD